MSKPIKQRQFFPGQPEAVPPVYVESMTLQEVRCFGEKQTLKFTKPDGSIAQWTVILGENGVGKTTVLQCLAGMRPELTDRGDEKQKGADKNSLLMPTLAHPYEIGLPRKWHRLGSPLIDPLPSTNADWPSEADWPGIKVELHARTIDMNFSRPVELLDWYACAAYSPDGLSCISNRRRPTPEFAGLHFYAYGASRRMAITGRKKFDTSATAESETLFNNENELHNAVEWLEDIKLGSAFEDGTESEKDRLQKEAAEKQLAEVLRMLPNVLPMVDEVRFERDPSSDKRVSVKFHTDHGWLPIESLSYGYQTMISWIVDFTRRMYDRYPDSPNPLAEPAIVLVDEIDLHLHPKWQRELTGFLSERFPKTQFIVTAHSPLIIQSEEVQNVILLKRDPKKPDQVIVLQDEIAEIRKWRLDQILTSELYGLVSAIAPSVEKLQMERDDILAKDELSNADNQRLAVIAEELDQLPTFSSPEAVKAEQLFKKTVDRLVEKDGQKMEAQAGC